MSVATRTTAIGVFYDQVKAELAVEQLLQAGFKQDQIGVAGRQPQQGIQRPTITGESKAEEAGVAGIIAGGVLGGLLGAGAVAAGLIPGIGPVIGAGILAAVSGGVAAGAVAGGLLGALIGMGIPEEEARYYQGEFEAGRTIVTVNANERYDQAIDTLKRCGAYGKGSPLV